MQRLYRFQEMAANRASWPGRIGLFAAAVAGIALVGALALLSLVIAVVLVPVVAVALLVLRWRIGRMQRQAAAARGGGSSRRPAIIETDYVVMDRRSDR
jgi:hypothetical protein